MTTDNEHSTLAKSPSPPPHHHAEDAFAKAEKIRPKRTLGERIVDWIVYPIVNNVVVFGISVAATYLTHRGDTVGKEGSTIREVGSWFKRRGEWMKRQFQAAGMNEKQADMGKMVFFSFADGTAVAPFVKLLEDRREHMAKWFDQKLGTMPEDESAYIVEPKQTWGSVISGRLATALIVVPTAVALDKKHITLHGETKNLNDHMFNGGSQKIARWLENKSSLKAWLPKFDIPYLSTTVVFEAFYTSVCTIGLYVSSRFIAKHNSQHKQALQEYRVHHDPHLTQTGAQGVAASREGITDVDAPPSLNVSETTHMARLAAPAAQEITA